MKAIKIFDEEFTSRNFNSSPLSIDTSDYDSDKFDYEIVLFGYGVSDADVDFTLRFNADNGSNYRVYDMRGTGSTASAAVNDTRAEIRIINMRRSAYPTLGTFRVTGSSGDERLVDYNWGGSTNSLSFIGKSTGYWKNTVDKITSIDIGGQFSGVSDAHIIVYAIPKVSQGGWEKVGELSWSSESTEKSFTGLDGDRDKKYKIVWDGDQTLNIEINNDATANYVRQQLFNTGSGIGSANATVSSIVCLNQSNIFIDALTGAERIVTVSDSRTTTTRQIERAFWYQDTATNITSLDCTPTVSASGTAVLYRKMTPSSTDVLPWELVESVDVNGDFSAGHTFSNLTGDSEVLYKLTFEGVSSAVSPVIKFIINNDTGNNYALQYLSGISSSASAASNSGTSSSTLGVPRSNKVAWGESIIYPRTGSNRPILHKSAYLETTVYKAAYWYLNTIAELTSIKASCTTSDTITGKLKLWRLK